MLTLAEFNDIRDEIVGQGYGSDIEWSEGLKPCFDPDRFGSEAVFVICNSGMKHTIAMEIYEKVMAALRMGWRAYHVFKHEGKALAIDHIWRNRLRLLGEYLLKDTAAEKLDFLKSLPWIGDITKYHLAKNLGMDVAKPDVHLARLADAEGCTAQELCDRLARETGYRAATVDVILWRACAVGIVNSRKLAA